MRARSWAWFVPRVNGLLAADTRLARHFAADPAASDDEGG